MVKKCLVLVNRLKHHESMSTKNHICILAGAALLVSCTDLKKNEAPSGSLTATPRARPSPTPRPRPTPFPGKRTETGTVIKVTDLQITLQCADGTWIINRTASTTVTGTLSVGSTVTVESNKEDWHLVSA
jgi:hypothetical protein